MIGMATSKREFSVWCALVLVACYSGLISVGCRAGSGPADPSQASFVPISYEEYRPDFGTSFAGLKGKTIRLLDFVNRAEDTSTSTYFDPTQSTTYGNPNSGFAGIGGRPLESYFWYCFQKAFQVIGVNVLTSSDQAQANVPSLQVTLKSINDTQFSLQVDMQRLGAPAISKPIVVSEPAAPVGQRSSSLLQARAYKMMSGTVQAVLSDPDFSKAISAAK
jgi:hypothetical protein